MMQEDKGPSPIEQVGIAVAIAALSTLASALVSWGVDEVRARISPKKKEEK